jgi:hypothetical protein
VTVYLQVDVLENKEVIYAVSVHLKGLFLNYTEYFMGDNNEPDEIENATRNTNAQR